MYNSVKAKESEIRHLCIDIIIKMIFIVKA